MSNVSITSVRPKISNWKELTEQFGVHTPLGKNYKTAVELSKELFIANSFLDLNDEREQPQPTKIKGVITHVEKDGEKTNACIMIDYEKDNFDSGICIFRLVKVEGEMRIYEYEGTAK